jgi:molybdate transport system ATP-binding protein
VTGEAALDLDVSLDLGALKLRATLATGARRIAIVGPSGAGKSTLLRVLAGLERRTAGRIACGGECWLDRRAGIFVPPHRRRAGWVPQDARLFPHRTVAENLRFTGASLKDATALAASFGVDHLLDRRPRHLSGGEAQRVALARALLSQPRLLLLDEPFAALDRARRERVSGVLKEVAAASDIIVVLVTHDEREVSSLAEEVFEMSEGRLAAPERSA